MAILSRKFVKIPVAHPVLIDMFTEGWKAEGVLYCMQGIPKDAILIGSYYDEGNSWAYLIFFHDSFKPIYPHEEIPTFIPVISTNYPEN